VSESLFEMVQSAADLAFFDAIGSIEASGKFAERAANGEEGEAVDEATVVRLRAIQAACAAASDSLVTILQDIRSA
jgi:hypothetical protein